MQELVLVLGSVAGACTAVAMDKIPKRKGASLVLKSNPLIKNQIHSLKIEKEILTKTISRLYQQESEISKIQRDKLLLRYQNQLGLVIAKIEKLENASKHPDLGPLGDGLITLMDQKLSQLDQRLHEISSKLSVSTPVIQTKPPEIKETVLEKPQPPKIEPKEESKPQKYIPMPPIEVATTAKSAKSVELVTLTELPTKIPEFPVALVKPREIVSTQEIVKEILAPLEVEKPKIEEVIQTQEIPKPEPEKPVVEKKIQIPTPVRIPEDEKIEDDDNDINKIKSEIMKALSKLEQVEVE